MTGKTDAKQWNAESLSPFLDAVAARQPTPGGGSVAAAAGALAGAMARMVAAYSPVKQAPPDTLAAVQRAQAELAEADRMLRQLIAEDAAAYQAFTDARASADASAQTQAAALALAVPMEIAAVSGSVLRVLNDYKSSWNLRLVSDLGVAGVLAEAAVRAATYNVRINLQASPQSDPRGEVRAEMDKVLDGAVRCRNELLEFVESRL